MEICIEFNISLRPKGLEYCLVVHTELDTSTISSIILLKLT